MKQISPTLPNFSVMATTKEISTPVESDLGNENGGFQPHIDIEEEVHIDPEEERRLVRKIDLRVMPLLFFMYLFK